MRSRLALVASVLLFAGCHSEPLPILGTVPPFTLTSETGQEFRSRQLAGKDWVADFVYTHCPGPCPRISSVVRQLQDGFPDRRDLDFVTFTVDPARDTPPVLAEYAKRFHATSGRWFFLTGSQPALHQIARYSFKVSNVDGTLEHDTHLVLVDRESRIRGYYDSSDPDSISQLKKDIKKLAKESD